MAEARVEFFYDLSSPWTYLAFTNLADILERAGAEAVLRPFLVGWIPQRQFLLNSLSVLDNVLLPLALAGKIDQSSQARAHELLRSLAMAGLAQTRPATLSVGQAARVCVARALLARPKLLLADEPTAALDTASSVLVGAELRKFADAGGAVIVASHDPALRTLLGEANAARVTQIELPDVRSGDAVSDGLKA